jgi:hypothetical protein
MATVITPSGATSAGAVVADRPSGPDVGDGLGVAAAEVRSWVGDGDAAAEQPASVRLQAIARVNVDRDTAIRPSRHHPRGATARAKDNSLVTAGALREICDRERLP